MNLNLIEERAKALKNEVSKMMDRGSSMEVLIKYQEESTELILDTKILCEEFGNQAIINTLGRDAGLSQCRKALEKILDTVPFRR